MATVEWLGASFERAESVGLMPLMKFAKVAKGGADSEDLDGLVAMYDLLEQCIAPADWERFQEHATAQHAGGEELMELVGKVINEMTERPTKPLSESSSGSSESGVGSEVAFLRKEFATRPDLEGPIIAAALARQQATG